jgi:resuscitation-promoting factor RpfC
MPPHARRLSLPLLLALIAALLIIASPAHASTAAGAAPPESRQQVTVLQISAITARAQQYARLRHLAHLAHLGHLHLMHTRYLAVLSARQAAAAQAAYQAQHPAYQAPAQQPAYQAPVQQAAVVSTAGDGSFQTCVITRESGGNASAVNPASGAGGLYGFLPSTWQSLGYSGLPENASVAEQNAAFQKEYAAAGASPWSASDGC